MPDYTLSALGIGASFLIAYFALMIYRLRNEKYEREVFLAAEKIAQSLQTMKLEQAISQAPYPFDAIARELREKTLEQALSDHSGNDALGQICFFLQRTNDASLVYQYIQRLKEISSFEKKYHSTAHANVRVIQFVAVLLMPVIYVFFSSILGFKLDLPINVFFGFLAVFASLADSIIYKKHITSLVKIPISLSIVYLIAAILPPYVASFSSFV